MQLRACSCAHAAVPMQLCPCSCAHAAVPMQLCPCSYAHAAVEMQLAVTDALELSQRVSRNDVIRGAAKATTPKAGIAVPNNRGSKTGTESSCRFGLEITSQDERTRKRVKPGDRCPASHTITICVGWS